DELRQQHWLRRAYCEHFGQAMSLIRSHNLDISQGHELTSERDLITLLASPRTPILRISLFPQLIPLWENWRMRRIKIPRITAPGLVLVAMSLAVPANATSHCVGSSHDSADRHDGCTKSHADEGALSQALSAARASRRSHWYAGARSLLENARLRSEGRAHSCRRDRVYRRLQSVVGMVRAVSRSAARSAWYRRRALGVARHVTKRI